MSDVQGAAPAAPTNTPAPIDSAPAAPQPVTIVEQSKPSMEDTMREVYTKLNPLRSEDGKFEAKDPPVAELDKPATEEPKPSTDQAQTTAPEPAKPAIEAPQSWSAEMKAEWAKLTPAQQEYIAKREGEAHKRITELGTTAKSAEGVKAVIDRHRASLKGANEAEAIDKLLSANAFLERSPTEAIKWLADAYRVDLRQFAASNPSPENAAPENAQLAHALREVAELRQALNETRNHVLTREQRETQSQQATLTKLIDDFKADPSRSPYWEKLEPDLHAQIIALWNTEPTLSPEQKLDKAFNRALRVNEDVSKQLEADTKAAAAKAKAAEDAKKAEEAKKHLSLNAKSRESGSPKTSGNWEDTLRETGRRLMKQAG
jgi:hypothetical protein